MKAEYGRTILHAGNALRLLLIAGCRIVELSAYALGRLLRS